MKKNNNVFPKDLTNTIHLGDAIDTLKTLPDNSVDMIFADPPYNMQIEGTLKRTDGTNFDGIEGNKWDEFDSLQHYREFTYAWLKEAKRVLKKDVSSLWVIGSFQNIYVVGSILQDLGYWLINDIVWSKTNPTPNFMGTKFTNRQETLLWATPAKNTKYKFNYKTMKALNGGKQMTSVWDIPVSSGRERIKDDNGNKLHPTQKPEKLLYNVIVSSSSEGDLILDPFMGSGTTGAMAKRLGRNFFGIERDEHYRDFALKRISSEITIQDDFTKATFDIKPPRVRFWDLIEANYISKDELIYFKKSDKVAKISTKKELEFDGEHYGISKLGGILEGKSTNANGWIVWFVKRDNKYVSLDEIRRKYRQKELGFYGK
ncbi:LlaDCHIB [Ligilactobacillus murinus DSM 20452 = NBRC 14221]|uniref:Methyltransferase n=1 Tax=Ligilactobacillus murinus DSM 20452 = NBRC 14221 TaxID=1423772 RepID=A0A0R2ATL9_9LACO|nr:site-specific DNA-methyltransferase [Ligilactobacillus murinus]KRM70263.1 LlaDCHIB [Ligilactobacillus murinus DSM 20452 = NBRC 14221]